MTPPVPENAPRVLIVDDNPSIHEDFRKILGAKTTAQQKLESVEADLFGHSDPSAERSGFRIDSAFQGEEALAKVQQALQENDPYVLAFVDVRMPPGWDGIETLERVWQVCPELQAVVCTAYSDYSWDDMSRRLGHTDNLLILKKPFETIEVLQIAHALTEKWTLGRQARLRMDDLDRMVQQRTAEWRASEERFSKAFQSSPIPMAILRCSDHHFVDVNRNFVELSGYPPDQLLHFSTDELQMWPPAAQAGSEAGLFSGESRLRHYSHEFRRHDGSTRQTVLSTEPLALGQTPCLLLIVEDMTDQLKLEAQLRHAQKMETIGRMAAGIAHEFNNLLTVIQGGVGLLQMPNSGKLDRGALLDQIMQASQRAAGFTRQLLAFGRKQVLQPRELNLSELAARMKKMLERLIGEKFDVHIDSSPDLPPVMADESGIEQILINLMLNARDSMPDGGVIRIAIEAAALDAPAVARNPEARVGSFICLSVTDHGAGMSPDVLSHLFDPFFTTKDVGKGTGLGLATIHGIVKQHEGWIEVISEIGRGSLFKVFLPACNPARPAAPKPPVAPAVAVSLPDPGRGETVLVVEDEDAVRELACAALQRRGYSVLKAANGPQAVEVWNRHGGNVDLLLTDMVMPNGMSGGELARVLQQRQPQLKVIYTSGYSPEILRQDSLLAHGINFLPKPYDLQTLLKSVRLCLDGGKLPQYEVRPGQTIGR